MAQKYRVISLTDTSEMAMALRVFALSFYHDGHQRHASEAGSDLLDEVNLTDYVLLIHDFVLGKLEIDVEIHDFDSDEFKTVRVSNRHDYRLENPDGTIYQAGTGTGSYFTLQKARELQQPGQKIYEYNGGERLWEVL